MSAESDRIRNEAEGLPPTDAAKSESVGYEYAVIRVVPRVHLDEFVNIGVILLARNAGFLDARVSLDDSVLRAVDPMLDPEMLDDFVCAYLRVCRGGTDAGPVGVLPQSGRFHWLTSPRSCALQTSTVHPGCSTDPAATLERLFAMYCGSGTSRAAAIKTSESVSHGE